MKKLLRYFKVKAIDVLVYRMVEPTAVPIPEIPYTITIKNTDGKTKYEILDNGKFVHESFVFQKLHLLKILGKTGPAIGQCATSENYRGQAIYPFVINRIASEILSGKTAREVFIIVNSDNIPSIRGIEKAGFNLYAKIKAKRFLLFYFDKHVSKT